MCLTQLLNKTEPVRVTLSTFNKKHPRIDCVKYYSSLTQSKEPLALSCLQDDRPDLSSIESDDYIKYYALLVFKHVMRHSKLYLTQAVGCLSLLLQGYHILSLFMS